MSIEFNNLLVALVFLLPGFLTSLLISARTPAVGREVSAFRETFESLLRSVYIHLLIAPVFFTVFWYFFVKSDASLLGQINKTGLKAYYFTHPFETIILLLAWLFAAFLLAVLFGSKWDPLEVLLSKLVTRTGTKSEDMFYLLHQYEAQRQKNKQENNQLWVQPRLKNGLTYRGKLLFAGYRREGMGRELMLADAKFFSNPAQTANQTQGETRFYDFVIFEFENCESLEFLFGPYLPTKIDKTNPHPKK
jgi:hypothetical protein